MNPYLHAVSNHRTQELLESAAARRPANQAAALSDRSSVGRHIFNVLGQTLMAVGRMLRGSARSAKLEMPTTQAATATPSGEQSPY